MRVIPKSLKVKLFKVVEKIRMIIVKNILMKIPEHYIWEHLGGIRSAGSPWNQFFYDGYDDLLTNDFELNSDDLVLILGAYKGNSATKWLDKYSAQLYLVEPVPDFVQELKKVFDKVSSVKIIPFAFSDRNEILRLNVLDAHTSQFIKTKSIIEVQSLDIISELNKLPKFPKVIECNIEGGEYKVLYRLIESQVIDQIDHFLIQFHNYNLKSEVDRATIRFELSKTHKLIYNYDWIWERWDKK
jgi:FkbM family methyltransferase